MLIYHYIYFFLAGSWKGFFLILLLFTGQKERQPLCLDRLKQGLFFYTPFHPPVLPPLPLHPRERLACILEKSFQEGAPPKGADAGAFLFCTSSKTFQRGVRRIRIRLLFFSAMRYKASPCIRPPTGGPPLGHFIGCRGKPFAVLHPILLFFFIV